MGSEPGSTEPQPKTAYEIRRAFAVRLKRVRQLHGLAIGQPRLSRNDFAKMLGMTDGNPGERYRHYEAARSQPPIWVLKAIREVTGYSLDYLIAGELGDCEQPKEAA